jgi:hypothetical protein
MKVTHVRCGYSLHLVGLYCNIVTFLLAIRRWNHVLASMRLLPVHNRPYGGFLPTSATLSCKRSGKLFSGIDLQGNAQMMQ